LLNARSAVVVPTDVVPPKRSLTAPVALFKFNVAPFTKFVVTKPNLPVAWFKLTVPLLTVNVPKMFDPLSPVSVHAPVPIFTTLNAPVV
jgi:hypothetical protein